MFTLATATPAGIGLIIGGRLADVRGRRRLIAVVLPVAAALLVRRPTRSAARRCGWRCSLGGIVGGIAYPALAVYRTELFPTGSRSRAAGLLTAAALLGGIVGLVVMGALLDAGCSHGVVLGWLALAQLAVVVVVLLWFPETAHRELEDLNPLDRRRPHVGVSARSQSSGASPWKPRRPHAITSSIGPPAAAVSPRREPRRGRLRRACHRLRPSWRAAIARCADRAGRSV